MFRIDGDLYYFRELKGNKAICEKENGAICYLDACLVPDEYKPSIFSNIFSKFSFLIA
jgi:hypothetical protein